MASWSNDEDSSFKEEEKSKKNANICLMAHEDEVNTENFNNFTFD